MTTMSFAHSVIYIQMKDEDPTVYVDVFFEGNDIQGSGSFNVWNGDEMQRVGEDNADGVVERVQKVFPDVDEDRLRLLLECLVASAGSARSYSKYYSQGYECETCGWNQDCVSASFHPSIKGIADAKFEITRELGCFGGYSYVGENPLSDEVINVEIQYNFTEDPAFKDWFDECLADEGLEVEI